MRVEKDGNTLSITVVSENIFRVRRFIGKDCPEKISLCVRPYEKFHAYTVTEGADAGVISTEKYSLRVDRGALSVTVSNQNGEILYQDSGAVLNPVDYQPFEQTIPDEVRGTYCARAIEYRLSFLMDDDEYIYGFGCHNCAHINLRGERIDLIQYNTYLPLPMFASSKKYGVFFDHYCSMQFNDQGSMPYLYVSNCEMADYYIICGDSQEKITASYRNLVGNAGLLPKYVFGYLQSKERYATQEELIDTVEQYRNLNVPIDMIVQDWQYWEEGQWGQKSFDKQRYPDPQRMIDKLHRMGCRVMISIWPKLEGESPNKKEMCESGQMLPLGYYNCFSQKGRDIYYQQLKQGIARYGFDGYWTDDTEPVEPGMDFNIKKNPELFIERQAAAFDEMSDRRFRNSYTFFHNYSLYKSLKKDYPEKRLFFLTRAGFPGLSAYNTATWTGDIAASWDCMRVQITSLVNHSIAGEPFCHNDIGAFFPYSKKGTFLNGKFPNGIKDREYKELYTRWLQFATFTPIMRSHGTGGSKELWNFGKKGTHFYCTIEKYIRLRMRLLPYIYSLAYAVHTSGKSFMNPLFAAFPNDKKTYTIDTQYLFGDAIMVCPVTRPMYYRHNFRRIAKNTKQKVYLPQNTVWYDFESGERYEGGRSILCNAPLDRMPLFVKAGSIIPMCEGQQSAAEHPSEIYLRIYSGADAWLLLYDDDGVSNEHENGVFRKISVFYYDADKRLVFSDALGDYQKNEPITFQIQTVGCKAQHSVCYFGEEVTVHI